MQFRMHHHIPNDLPLIPRQWEESSRKTETVELAVFGYMTGDKDLEAAREEIRRFLYGKKEEF